MQKVDASIAAIIASTMPLIVAFLGWSIFRNQLNFKATFGLILGFTGVLVIMTTRIQSISDLGPIILCIIGSISLAIATLSVKNAGSGGNLWIIVGYQMIIGSVVLLPFALFFEKINVIWSPKLLIAFSYTTLIPGLLATWVWFVLVSEVGAIKGATYHFLNPFFGVLIAYIVLNEGVGLYDYIGVIIISLGIMAVQFSQTIKS